MKKYRLRRGGLWILHEARPQALLPVLFITQPYFPAAAFFRL